MPQYCRHPILPMLKFSDLRKEHPDVSKLPDAKQRWQELSAAYDALSDPETCLGMILLLVLVLVLLLLDWIVKGPEDRAKARFFELVPDLVGFRIVDF